MLEQVFIVNIHYPEIADEQFVMQQEEMQSLVETAGGEVVAKIIQKRERPDAKWRVGQGKVNEIKRVCEQLDAELVIFYDQLSPSQNRNLQEAIGVAVIDRVQLILDIFALRATSKEGKLQVALAQNQYLLPRLQGLGNVLSRLGGGIGTRGPGETQLEQDRRLLRKQIQQIKQDLAKVSQERALTRQKRRNSHLFQVGLFGYTNAGKSTLINGLAAAETYEQDELFATLTPLTRTYTLPNQFEIALTDTVGFIQDLPPMVIDAFHSTLEESQDVDLLLIVIDASSPYRDRQKEVVMSVIEKLGMQSLPHLFVYNKCDLIDTTQLGIFEDENTLLLSAYDGDDLTRLNRRIVDKIKTIYVPVHSFVKGEDINGWLKQANRYYIEAMPFDEINDGYQIEAYLPVADYERYYAERRAIDALEVAEAHIAETD
ncbi:MAG: GTPase HflX [Aerococcus sp.]|nr:GTPase HflX [Aerococcus sp.]